MVYAMRIMPFGFGGGGDLYVTGMCVIVIAFGSATLCSGMGVTWWILFVPYL